MSTALIYLFVKWISAITSAVCYQIPNLGKEQIEALTNLTADLIEELRKQL